jgi:predicted GNAT family N-acyltransferase
MVILQVAVLEKARGSGIGKSIMQAMLQHARTQYPALLPKLSAQTHAIAFYRKLGWQQFGGEFDDAGIPHVAMVLPPDCPEARAGLAAWGAVDVPGDITAILKC